MMVRESATSNADSYDVSRAFDTGVLRARTGRTSSDLHLTHISNVRLSAQHACSTRTGPVVVRVRRFLVISTPCAIVVYVPFFTSAEDRVVLVRILCVRS